MKLIKDPNDIYFLEIYEPGSAEDVLKTFESNIPFLGIARGDYFSPSWILTDARTGLLRVVNIEHIIWEVGDRVKHKICVFTEDVENTKEIRLRN